VIQCEQTRRAPDLYLGEAPRNEATLISSVLLAYKLDWQSVLFVGYGDQREHSAVTDALEPMGHRLFVKASYALQ
jgi:hypothetical protein